MKIIKTAQVREYQFDNDENRYWGVLEKEEPFKETDRLRLFHGFRNIQDAYITQMYGLSGKEKVGRAYSYEDNNNPTGLFVTLDFSTAKKFSSYNPVIMEFTASYSDLESPVWPGGKYTIQGEMSKSWSWDKLDEEREQGRMLQREEALRSEFSAIRESERPELASMLMNGGEHQALFTGDLSPNEIDAFWVTVIQEDGVARVNDPWVRLSPSEFIEKEKEKVEKMRNDTKGYRSNNRYKEVSGRIFTPDEDFNMTKICDELEISYEKIMTMIRGWGKDQSLHVLEKELWPKQLRQAEQWLDSLFNEATTANKSYKLIRVAHITNKKFKIIIASRSDFLKGLGASVEIINYI